MKTFQSTVLTISLLYGTSLPAVDSDAVLGGAVGGGVGAAVGSEVAGREGAILGGAMGAALGTAIATSGEEPATKESGEKVIYVEEHHYHGPPGHAYGHRIPPGHFKHGHKHKHNHGDD
jgi:hypothetical protein